MCFWGGQAIKLYWTQRSSESRPWAEAPRGLTGHCEWKPRPFETDPLRKVILSMCHLPVQQMVGALRAHSHGRCTGLCWELQWRGYGGRDDGETDMPKMNCSPTSRKHFNNPSYICKVCVAGSRVSWSIPLPSFTKAVPGAGQQSLHTGDVATVKASSLLPGAAEPLTPCRTGSKELVRNQGHPPKPLVWIFNVTRSVTIQNHLKLQVRINRPQLTFCIVSSAFWKEIRVIKSYMKINTTFCHNS